MKRPPKCNVCGCVYMRVCTCMHSHTSVFVHGGVWVWGCYTCVCVQHDSTFQKKTVCTKSNTPCTMHVAKPCTKLVNALLLIKTNGPTVKNTSKQLTKQNTNTYMY